MYYNVHIKPSGHNLAVADNETVLASALRQGYQFPHECVEGVCGTCKGQLLEGEVAYDHSMLPALTDDERNAGYALFCSAKPRSDLVIHVEDVIGPEQFPIKQLVYAVKVSENLSPKMHRIILQPPANDHFDYRAGQYLEILHRDKSAKPFSITNAPLGDDKHIELHIRHLPGHAETQELLDEIQSTGKLLLRAPLGNCILRHEPPHPIILLAGGTGFAPFKALIEQALAEGLQRPLYLYWGARTFEDLYLHDLVSRWANYVPEFHYIPVLSESLASDHWLGRTGLVHDAVLTDHSNLAQFHVYASGPIEMVYAALHTFQQHGLQRHLMYSDIFEYMQ